MSTTFGVKINGEPGEDIIEVARRIRGIEFTNEIAYLLPDETPVIPMNNDAQGIYTIGDIKAAILEQSISQL